MRFTEVESVVTFIAFGNYNIIWSTFAHKFLIILKIYFPFDSLRFRLRIRILSLLQLDFILRTHRKENWLANLIYLSVLRHYLIL